jgi:hypothetical protein
MVEEASDTAQIEQNLADTRERMDQRLGALQEKLTPRQLVNDGLAYFQGNDGADFTRELVARVRANPVPAFLIGGGVAWLLASRASSTVKPIADTDLHSRLQDAERSVTRTSDDSDASFSDKVADARGQVFGLTRSATDTASSYGQRISNAMTNAAHSGGTSPREKARSAGRALINPLGLGAIAAATGAVLGSLLPSSDYETERLSASATKLREAGRDAVQDIVDRGSRVAGEALDAIQDGASAKGLTADKPIGETLADIRSGDLVSDAQDVLAEAVETGRNALHGEFQPK